jgi:integrase
LKFPKRVKHRGKELATIYGKSKSYPQYRVAWSVGGKRRMKAFDRYGGEDGALVAAEKLAAELYKGSQSTALSAAQANDALAALESLDSFFRQTGQRLSLRAAVSDYCDVAALLQGRSLREAVEGYLATVASVKRMDLAKAVEHFIETRKPLMESKGGKRPAHNPIYERNVARWLRGFATTFPGHAVCDINKALLQKYVEQHAELSAKNRNDKRAAVKMFLRWCVEQDYLSSNHRLFEKSGALNAESLDAGEIDFYRPSELRSMVDCTTGEFSGLLPVIVLSGLGGLRLEEVLRLTWADVWRVPGHIEVSALQAKTRQRRLVQVCPALAQWLALFRDFSGPVWTKSASIFHADFTRLRESLEIPARRNGLRHSFITFSFALHGETVTAAEAGTSPGMIFQHYRGLATKAEAEKWFAVAPAKPANVVPLTETRGAL